MAKITISEDKLSVKSNFTAQNMIIVAVIFVFISVLFWFFVAFHTWLFITVMLNTIYAGWILFEFFLNYNHLEIDFAEYLLVEQFQLGHQTLKRKELNGINADSFWIDVTYHNGKHYNLYYGDQKKDDIIWSFKRSEANRVNAWLNEYRKFHVEIE